MFKVKIWGARGSMSTFGSEYSKYSGNTSCVEVLIDQKQLIFDGGTGIIKLGKLISNSISKKELDIFFSHYHYDHIIGLLNFLPIYNKDFTVNFYGQSIGNKNIRDIITNILKHPYYPIEWKSLQSQTIFIQIAENDLIKFNTSQNKEIIVTPISTIHPNKNLAYKISYEDKKFIYLTDFAHYPEENDKIVEFVKNSDLIIYDSNFTPEEYHMKTYEGWGHSHWLNAVKLANDSNSKKLVLFHHKVDRTDSELEKILEESRRYFNNTYLAKEEDEYIL